MKNNVKCYSKRRIMYKKNKKQKQNKTKKQKQKAKNKKQRTIQIKDSK